MTYLEIFPPTYLVVEVFTRIGGSFFSSSDKFPQCAEKLGILNVEFSSIAPQLWREQAKLETFYFFSVINKLYSHP
ncbi:hypothetical protein [Anabaena sp. CCY 0017]|uniref:hypothetical protein n=1 Tax=Anabaena sp. CCY 0017 TaxID=3103866 RepID=UPI0039C5DCDC